MEVQFWWKAFIYRSLYDKEVQNYVKSNIILSKASRFYLFISFKNIQLCFITLMKDSPARFIKYFNRYNLIITLLENWKEKLASDSQLLEGVIERIKISWCMTTVLSKFWIDESNFSAKVPRRKLYWIFVHKKTFPGGHTHLNSVSVHIFTRMLVFYFFPFFGKIFHLNAKLLDNEYQAR